MSFYSSQRSRVFYCAFSLGISLVMGLSGSFSEAGKVKKYAAVALPFLLKGALVPTAEAGGTWYSGTNLGCTSYARPTVFGITSVVCSGYGDSDHGVGCETYDLGTDGAYAGVVCSSAWVPDEAIYRGCTDVSGDTIAGYPGVFCSEYGIDRARPYCVTDSLVTLDGVANPVCDTLYCPNCLYYVSDRAVSCFPEKTFVQVKDEKGATSLVSMRDLRLGMTILASYAADGSEVYSPIKSIPHRNPTSEESYIEIKYRNETESGSFLVSRDHLIHFANNSTDTFNDATTPTQHAQDIKAGDRLWSDRGQQVEVVSSLPVGNRTGVYAPRTELGTLVIFGSPDGGLPVVTSSYAKVKNPALAHAYFNAREAVFPPKQIEDDSVVGDDAVTKGIVAGLAQLVPSQFGGSAPSADQVPPVKWSKGQSQARGSLRQGGIRSGEHQLGAVPVGELEANAQ